MTDYRAKPGLRFALALLVLAIVIAASALQRLSLSRAQTHRHSQGLLEQSRTAIRAQNMVAQQETAIRDLVLATQPSDIQEAEDRFEALARGYAVVQERLFSLFAVDSETSDKERSLLGLVRQEQLKTIGPLQRVVALAHRNQDELATQILIDEVLPHQSGLRGALTDLVTVQQKQNQARESSADQAYAVALTATAVLGALGTLMVAVTGWRAARAALSDRASGHVRRAGLPAGSSTRST